MKQQHTLMMFIAILLVTAFAVNANAQPKPWTKGHVFIMEMIKILPGHNEDYVSNLKTNFKLTNDEAIKEGLLVSYRMFMGQGSTPADYNFMILFEYPDANSAHDNDDKWGAIRQKVIGDNSAYQSLTNLRTTQREILGDKTMEEIFFK